MTQENIKYTFIKYVSLNVIGMIGLSCYILADTFFVARGLGAVGLTSLNLAIPIYSFIQGVGLMLGMGAATRFAISKLNSVFTQAIYYGCFFAVIFLIIGMFFAKKLAYLLGADIDTIYSTTIYLKVILCFSPMFLLNNILICFVRNDKSPKLSMVAMLVGSLSNIILDYIFVFPCQMGMLGAALATGIAPIISIAILSLHFIKKRHTFHLIKLFPKIKQWRDISFLGAAALITEISSGVVIVIFNGIILRLDGNIGVAAYGIIANIALVIIAIFTGISQGMQPIISLCYNEKKLQEIRNVLKYGISCAIIIAIIVYILSVTFAKPLVSIFNKDGNIVLNEIAIKGIKLYFTGFVFVGVNIISATYFSAIGSSKNAFIISILRGLVVIVPMVIIMSITFGTNGVWISLPLTEIIVCVYSINKLKGIIKG